MEETLSVEEVARLLKVKPATVREWARQGKLRGCRIGRRWLFLRQDIRGILDGEAKAAAE